MEMLLTPLLAPLLTLTLLTPMLTLLTPLLAPLLTLLLTLLTLLLTLRIPLLTLLTPLLTPLLTLLKPLLTLLTPLLTLLLGPLFTLLFTLLGPLPNVNGRSPTFAKSSASKDITMSIDFNKPVRTKSGIPVQIITTNGREPYSVVGYIGDDESPGTWTADGVLRFGSGDELDLENFKKRGWINIYPEDAGYLWKNWTHNIYATKTEADSFALGTRIACIEIEVP